MATHTLRRVLACIFALQILAFAACPKPIVPPTPGESPAMRDAAGVLPTPETAQPQDTSGPPQDSPLQPPADRGSCQPTSCADKGAQCGQIQDGCGNTLSCGICPTGQVCGGSGQPNVCGGGSCTPKTCQELGASCGDLPDGCGKTIKCGVCKAPQVCGGGGTAHVCGVGSCTPKTCQQLGANCGDLSDGCGKTIKCGACKAPQVCGGGGKAHVCGVPACTPKTCQELGANCGDLPDGCGKTLKCGACKAPQSCGGGGKANVCGGGSCTPKTCQELGASCGDLPDGCGKTLKCGACKAPQTCGGGGKANVCGAPTCAAFARRAKVVDLTPGASVSYLNKPVMLSTLSNGEVRLAWADTTKKLHITRLKSDGTRIGADQTLKGESVHGFVAHNASNALLYKDGDSMILTRLNAKGAAMFKHVLVGGNKHVAGDRWVDSWPHRGRLIWANQRYIAYFGHNYYWNHPQLKGKHQGDMMVYYDGSGKKVSGGWTWKCSHSIDVRLAWDGTRVGAICGADCFCQGRGSAEGLLYSPTCGVLFQESGNCSRGLAPLLGDLIPIANNGFLHLFATTYDSTKKSHKTHHEIALVRIDTRGKASQTRFLTNAPTIPKSAPQMARYGKNYLVAWLESRKTTKVGVININGKFLQGPVTINAPLNSLTARSSDRGDFANLPNGDVVWAVANASNKISYVRFQYCP